MRKLIMEIRQITDITENPIYLRKATRQKQKSEVVFYGGQADKNKTTGARLYSCVNNIKTRPVMAAATTGLVLFAMNPKKNLKASSEYARGYLKNIKHTYDHKIIHGIIEKKLYGKNSMDTIYHDSDKLLMYLIGLPRKFVSKTHRRFSEHHPESGRTELNLKDMLTDNIASSPFFKPDKKYGLREYFEKSKDLQAIKGFREHLEKYNFGEDLDFNEIKRIKDEKYSGIRGMCRLISKTFKTIFNKNTPELSVTKNPSSINSLDMIA